MQVVVICTVHLLKLFLIAELVWLFFNQVTHLNNSAGEDIADVALDWCTDYDISYDGL